MAPYAIHGRGQIGDGAERGDAGQGLTRQQRQLHCKEQVKGYGKRL